MTWSIGSMDCVEEVVALLEEVELDAEEEADPAATEAGMEGLLVVMKLPRIVWKALARSAPMFDCAG